MRKGFLLIELSVAIVILLSVFSLSIVSIKKYREYNNEIKYKKSIFEIEDFLSMAKIKAINRNKSQIIEIKNEDGNYVLKLEEEGKVTDYLLLGNTWESVSVNISNIDVNKFGFIKPCTMKMINGKNKYRITIQAGGDLISDYKD